MTDQALARCGNHHTRPKRGVAQVASEVVELWPHNTQCRPRNRHSWHSNTVMEGRSSHHERWQAPFRERTMEEDPAWSSSKSTTQKHKINATEKAHEDTCALCTRIPLCGWPAWATRAVEKHNSENTRKTQWKKPMRILAHCAHVYRCAVGLHGLMLWQDKRPLPRCILSAFFTGTDQ